MVPADIINTLFSIFFGALIGLTIGIIDVFLETPLTFPWPFG